MTYRNVVKKTRCVLFDSLRRRHVLSFLIVTHTGWLISASPTIAANIDHFSTNTLSPNDYLFGANGSLSDPIFDKYRTIDLNVDIGIGSDCGRISIRNTLRAALKNILDTKYLEDMGRDVLVYSMGCVVEAWSPVRGSLVVDR